ncbi:MAG: 3'(2'),5'-bisphosphate nucleotidase CysQ [Bacteroidia bacterium]|nr:3'(2'),5'-bisphosphate nucleotidase CysQ [Bacteroidia bacterium]
MELKSLLQTAITASIAAGKEILDVYAQPITVEVKDDKSPLTLADKRSHLKIMEYLKNTGVQVLSEEGKHMDYSERAAWKQYWLVDPLDGTKEFIKRNGEFTVNIALIKDQVAILGVIYVPVLNQLYFAAQGIGSYKCEDVNLMDNLNAGSDFLESLQAASRMLSAANKPTTFTAVASRSHNTPETDELIDALRKQHGTVDLISKGSSLKLCLVAEGAANIYPRLAPTMEWDTAAGQAIAEVAGCTVIDYHTKKPMVYNKENLLNPWFVVSSN